MLMNVRRSECGVSGSGRGGKPLPMSVALARVIVSPSSRWRTFE
jgi:hypothetical protein